MILNSLNSGNEKAQKNPPKGLGILTATALTATLFGSSCTNNKSPEPRQQEAKTKIEITAPEKKTSEEGEKTIKFKEANTDKTQGENIASTESWKNTDDWWDLANLPEEEKREILGFPTEKAYKLYINTQKKLEKTLESENCSEKSVREKNAEQEFCKNFESYIEGLKQLNQPMAKSEGMQKAQELYNKLKKEGF